VQGGDGGGVSLRTAESSQQRFEKKKKVWITKATAMATTENK
jgi:hypothetical protein